MNDEELDLRLRQAVRPLVTEVVPAAVAREAPELGVVTRRGMTAFGVVAALGIVVIIALAGAYRLSGLAGTAAPAPSVNPGVETTVRGTQIITPDGQVSVRRSTDGANLELVLQKSPSTTVVLASFPERVPGSNDSFISVHMVDCPPATGLAQQYYVFGQNVFGTTTSFPSPVLQGIAGVGTPVSRGLYAIAITSKSIPSGQWRFHFADGAGGGGLGSSLLDLPSYGDVSAAGCFFDPK